MKRSQVEIINELNAFILSISFFPKELSEKLCPNCVGPAASASPVSPYRSGSREGLKLPLVPCVQASGMWGDGEQG